MSRLMLRILFAALSLPILGMAQTGSQAPAAQTPAVIGAAKIAWMNLEQAVLTSDEGKSMVADIQKYVDTKNVENDNLRKEAETLRNQLSVQGSKLTDEARDELEAQIESKETSLQRFQQDTQKEIENRRVRMTNYLAKKIQPIIESYAKERGLSAILIFNSTRDAYVDPSLNVTEDIIKLYNAKNGAGKPPATAAPKPPATPAPKK